MSQPVIASRCAVAEVGRQQGCGGRRMPQRTWAGLPATCAATAREAAGLADLHDLDALPQHLGECGRRGGEGPPTVVLPAAQAVQQLPQRLAAPCRRRGTRTVGPGRSGRNSASNRAARRGQSARQHRDEIGPAFRGRGDERRRDPASSAPLVRTGRIGSAGQDGAHARSARAVATARISTPSSTSGRTRQPAEAPRGGKRAQHALGGCNDCHLGGRGGGAGERGRSTAASGSVRRRCVRELRVADGEPREHALDDGVGIRDATGAAVAPTRRQAPRDAPDERDRGRGGAAVDSDEARRSLLTEPMLPAAPRAVRRPSRRPRRAPRAGRSAPRCRCRRGSARSRRRLAAEQVAQDRVEEEHRRRAERTVGRLASRKCTAGPGQAPQPDLAATASTSASRRSSIGSSGEAHRAAVPDTAPPGASVAGRPGPTGATPPGRATAGRRRLAPRGRAAKAS